MKRRAMSLTIAAAASVTGLGLSAPALAAQTPAGQKAETTTLKNCPANSICGWSGAYFTGMMTTFPVGSPCAASPVPLRSIANTFPAGTGVPVRALVYAGTYCSGTLLANVGGGQSVPSLPVGALSVAVTV
jgi:Peptidase inhibitor family I36